MKKECIPRQWLTDLREEKKLSIQQVANKVGKTYQFINAVEHGKRRPKPETAKAIADVLGFYWAKLLE